MKLRIHDLVRSALRVVGHLDRAARPGGPRRRPGPPGSPVRARLPRRSARDGRLRAARGELSSVRLVYAPERDGEPDPGEVVWTWVPYEEDPTQGKDRPVVVIGTIAGEHVGVPLTSRADRGRFRLGRGAWDGFGHESYAKVDQLVRIGRGEMRREGAALDPHRYRGLIEELRRRHGAE